MLSRGNLPISLSSLVAPFRTRFTAPSYTTFSALVAGFLVHPGERNVFGMLSGAGLAQRWHHSRAHRFFSKAPWSTDPDACQSGFSRAEGCLTSRWETTFDGKTTLGRRFPWSV